MTAVFREVRLTWEGKEYFITPDMALINRIEQDYSLSKVAYRVAKGEPPISHLAGILAVMLRSKGVKVSDEEVYREIMLGDGNTQQQAAEAIMYSLYPQGPEGTKRGKPETKAKANQAHGSS